MDPFPFYALPDDALGCILRMALAANGSTMQARRDLSLLCRRWRDSLRGAQPARDVGSVGDVTQLSACSSLFRSREVGFGAQSLCVCPVGGQDRRLPSIRDPLCTELCPDSQTRPSIST